MQRFLFSILLLCLQATALWGQSLGCEAVVYPSEWLNGQTVLTAYNPIFTPISAYSWSNGGTTESIAVTGTGTYCVTITTINGCTASGCYEITGNCEVKAWWGPDTANGGYQIGAWSRPSYLSAGATYLWSNGATDAEINVPTSGTYCVTATLPNGCTATKCVEIPVNTDCFFNWSMTITETWGQLKAVPFYAGNYTYLWSSGASAQAIDIVANDDYCCTVTSTDGSCQMIKCYKVNWFQCAPVKVEQSGNTLTALVLDPASTAVSYLWNTGATTTSIPVTGPGTYRVTITFDTGCSTSASKYIQPNLCSASVAYNPDNTLTAQATGTAPFTYAWQPGGFTTPTIAPTANGYYSVVVTDANGCTSLAGRHWYRADSCAVQIYVAQDSFPGPDVWLYASTDGNWNDWTYLWNNGSTSSNLFVAAAGEYCVTATNTQSGCTAVRCIWLQPDSTCYAQIGGTELDPSTWQLSATSGPATAATYAWSTGATTPSITVNQSGYYAVTVTDAEGCIVSAYYDLHPVVQLIVNVHLSSDSSIMPSPGNGVHARLYLIRYDTAQGGTLTAVDTTDTYSWSDWWALGAFKNVPPGYYLIKAALLPGSTGYADHLPTYYQSSLFWHDATTFQYSSFSPNDWLATAHITLIKGQNPGGPGFIGGLVSQGANFTGNNDDRGEGDPLPGISIVLTLPDGTPVAHATTDANGQYSFPNLPWGTYVLTIDIPGLAPVSTTVTIGPGQPSASNVNFKVDGDSAGVSGTDDLGAGVSVKIFPNPVRDVLWVESIENATLTLSNATGQVVRQLPSNSQRTQVTMADLPSGMYFLTVHTATAMQTLKVVKE